MTTKSERKTVSTLAKEVKAGKWGKNDDEASRQLLKEGYLPSAIFAERDAIADPDRKSLEDLAKEVKAGKWGEGEVAFWNLSNAGFNSEGVRLELDALK